MTVIIREKRMIQYAAVYRLYLIFSENWMPAFARMTSTL